jgi:hypothetical protein
VRGGAVPALLLPPCVVVPVRSLLGSGFLETDGAPVSLAQRGRRRTPSSFPFLPLLLSRQWNRGMGKFPKANGGRPAGGLGSRRLGIGYAGEESGMAAPQWPAELLMLWFRGQKGPFPLGASLGESACAAAQRSGRPGGAAVPSGARGRVHAGAERDKGEGKEDKGGWPVGPTRQREKRKRKRVAMAGPRSGGVGLGHRLLLLGWPAV